jgi:hypothetical protein
VKKVFVCSPFGGKQVNIDRAKEYCKFVLSQEHAPYAPHLMFPSFLDDNNEKERDLGIASGLEYLKECDEMWIFLPEGEELSRGMRREIVVASESNVVIQFPYQAFLGWMKGEKK